MGVRVDAIVLVAVLVIAVLGVYVMYAGPGLAYKTFFWRPQFPFFFASLAPDNQIYVRAGQIVRLGSKEPVPHTIRFAFKQEAATMHYRFVTDEGKVEGSVEIGGVIPIPTTPYELEYRKASPGHAMLVVHRTETPTETPTSTPTQIPTNTPTETPTNTPTETPTEMPTDTPTETDTNA